MSTEVTLRYRMSDRDVFYGGGVVNGARSITLMEDTANRLMTKVYGNQSRCAKVRKVRLFVPCFAGDYMEYKARLLGEENGRAIIEVRSFKVAVIPEEPEFESSIDVLEDPPLSTVCIFEYVIPANKEKKKAKALEGLKVLDLTHAYNGPFCTALLADNGAEVIKIEPLTGDQSRYWPPMDDNSGESGFYAFINRNKKGVTLNLKTEKGREIFYDLVREADVVVENFRVGVTKKLKVDYETLKKINPRIIYASGSGFGQYGPFSNRPCYDIVAQALGGMINLTGYTDAPPVKCGVSVADNVTGIYLCVGVLMALYRRTVTGEGQQAKDGYIALGVGTDKLFKVFCDVIGRPDLVTNEKFATNDLRIKNYNDGLHEIIVDWVKQRGKAEVESMFEEVGIPCGQILDMKEAIEHPHFKAREMMVHVEHPTIGDMYIQGCPIKLSETPGSVDAPAPLLGQHNKEVYGFDDETLKQLKEEGVI